MDSQCRRAAASYELVAVHGCAVVPRRDSPLQLRLHFFTRSAIEDVPDYRIVALRGRHTRRLQRITDDALSLWGTNEKDWRSSTSAAVFGLRRFISHVPALAQEAGDRGDGPEEIIVTGMRETQRTSIGMERASPMNVDGIINAEIGALPDNPVGDTLERITGVAPEDYHTRNSAFIQCVTAISPTKITRFLGLDLQQVIPSRGLRNFPGKASFPTRVCL